MKVSTSILCDFASVREGLLFVVGGGITRIWREQFPASLSLSLALMIELHPHEAKHPHQLEVVVSDSDGKELMKFDAGFQVMQPGLEVGERHLMPIALQIPVGLESTGAHSVDVFIDGQHHADLQFHAESRPTGPQGTSVVD